MSPRIDRLWPNPDADLDDEALLAAYAFPADQAWLRMNFVSSLDGAATREELSAGLGDEADHRVFDLLRRPAHAVLVAAGTARAEGYGAMRLDDASARWRESQGLAPHPVFALVTRSLHVDPTSPVFADAPVRPVVYTVASAPSERRAALEPVADVVVTGDESVDLRALRDDLAARGCTRIHSEGGPSFFGACLTAGIVDELCLTLAPTLEGGDAARIAGDTQSAPTSMRLASVLRARDELLLRYVRG
ncbi:pyrimidine reductase family protein [Microbacterium suaedae]|uniref:pyrimidine reductase family protein n=1 Tax=Microbacterium suaedae TaxID=2067813 RepID=UPI000DA117C2|nr:pyrimidine reductase family protein [Microbacterium suaedae]